MTLPIAQVAVDQATIHFDKLYSYRVPAELQDHVWPGSMVLSTKNVVTGYRGFLYTHDFGESWQWIERD